MLLPTQGGTSPPHQAPHLRASALASSGLRRPQAGRACTQARNCLQLHARRRIIAFKLLRNSSHGQTDNSCCMFHIHASSASKRKASYSVPGGIL